MSTNELKCSTTHFDGLKVFISDIFVDICSVFVTSVEIQRDNILCYLFGVWFWYCHYDQLVLIYSSNIPLAILYIISWIWYGMILAFGRVVLTGDWLGLTS